MVNVLWAAGSLGVAALGVAGLRRWHRWHEYRTASYWTSIPGDPTGTYPLGALLSLVLVGGVALVAIADLFHGVLY